MSMKQHWQLSPGLTYLNHGSYGATPRVVLREQSRLRELLECNPMQFLSPERDLEPQLDDVRAALARLVGARAQDLAFVRSATDGVNAVLGSLPLECGDDIVVTTHGYNACVNAARYFAQRNGATLRVAAVPFPLAGPEQVLEVVEAALTARSKLLLIDHVTSPTGLVFPVAELVALAHARGVRVLVDGAHAPGMLPLDLARLGADYYTGNHHKWLCAPKASGFLHVQPCWQPEVRPALISHAANRPRPGRSRFIAEFDWTGTFDPTALLSLPAAIGFLDSLYPDGIGDAMRWNRRLALEGRARLCDALQTQPPAPESMLGSMAAVVLPQGLGDAGLQVRLRDEYAIEVPVIDCPGSDRRLLRLSMQAYNDMADVERLIEALLECRG
jgi:isopenicillin-N epimerase